jgi:Asp-tRNA(Asn)/Glu-tRNA(Gln) amidotransferase B subunit
MKLVDDITKRWEEIVNDVDKEHIPIECVKKIVFKLEGSKQKTINLSVLRRQGLDSEEIQSVVERYIHENEDIVNMDFVLDIEAVASILQPETDKLLKDI